MLWWMLMATVFCGRAVMMMVSPTAVLRKLPLDKISNKENAICAQMLGEHRGGCFWILKMMAVF